MELRLPAVVVIPDAGDCKPEDLVVVLPEVFGVVYSISEFTVVPIISMSGK